jgi:hypothetical protein
LIYILMEAVAVNENAFWGHLEFRVCHEMDSIEEYAKQCMYCDGFEPTTIDLDARPQRISGKAWIGDGRLMEFWDFELLLPTQVSSREEIRWAELLPPEDVTAWLDVDSERKCLVVAPGDAEMW